MTSSKSHYELLGISSSADSEALRKAFCKLSKELHPDTTSLPQDEAAKSFQQVCEAYEVLTDPILRKAYDSDITLQENTFESNKFTSDFNVTNSLKKYTFGADRRPFSGGELFSLLLLGIALLISLLLAIGFGMMQGRELIVRPTWLSLNYLLAHDQIFSIGWGNGSITFK
ncbi:J domain-containing protein [Prochlorococcus sp. MIT 1223]|uniref:J domain-containing protein n=1 Tax=Prochlorococcus sp. MIT 1223 TaxID=3096217 RepID=UPI002A75B01A|nr:J domain-containing protein [Prochlorococcus sp. MIT 1223]